MKQRYTKRFFSTLLAGIGCCTLSLAQAPFEVIGFDALEQELFETNTQVNGYGFNQTTLDTVSIQQGRGRFITPAAFRVDGDFMVYDEGGNPGAYLGRRSTTKFGRGVAYVFNNTNSSASGLLPLGFDYFYDQKLDADRLSYAIYGINDDEMDGIDGFHRMDGGSGAFGDNSAVLYDGADGTLLAGDNALAYSDSWTKISQPLDVTGYEWIIIAVGHATNDGEITEENMKSVMGLDNFVVPTNAALSVHGSELSRIAVYPNPTKAVLTVANVDGAYDYSVVDLLGKTVAQNSGITSNTIDLGALNNGVYFLQLDTANGTTVKRIVKK